MRFRDDERGVTVQVGAVLLLGIIVISLSIYQVQVVPAQNEQVEFDHSQAVQTDLQQVRNAILGTAATGTSTPTAVQLGARYPARAIFVNPPPVSGSLRTEDAGQVRIENARAVNPDTADYWRGESAGDAGFDKSFATDRIVYSADYAVYDNAPTTVYANSVVYNDFEGGNAVSLSDETLIEDRTISLVALDGRLSTSRTDTVTVDPQAVSASTRTVAVENEGGPVTITVPTDLSETEWETLLEDEYATNGGPILDGDANVTVASGELTVRLEPGVYRLKLAKVGVGTNVGGTTPTYLTTVERPEVTTPDTTQYFSVEVRDGFDNPISGQTVEATADRGTVTPVASSLSDEDGRVTFAYTAPPAAGDGDVQIDVSYEDPTRTGFDDGNPQDISYVVDVQSAGGGGGGSNTAPTVESFDVTDNSGQKNNRDVQYDVSWSVSDSDGNLDSVTIRLFDRSNQQVDNVTSSVSGSSASGTATLTDSCQENKGGCQNYEIEIVVTDTDGASASATETDEADGNGPSSLAPIRWAPETTA